MEKIDEINRKLLELTGNMTHQELTKYLMGNLTKKELDEIKSR